MFCIVLSIGPESFLEAHPNASDFELKPAACVHMSFTRESVINLSSSWSTQVLFAEKMPGYECGGTFFFKVTK